MSKQSKARAQKLAKKNAIPVNREQALRIQPEKKLEDIIQEEDRNSLISFVTEPSPRTLQIAKALKPNVEELEITMVNFLDWYKVARTGYKLEGKGLVFRNVESAIVGYFNQEALIEKFPKIKNRILEIMEEYNPDKEFIIGRQVEGEENIVCLTYAFKLAEKIKRMLGK